MVHIADPGGEFQNGKTLRHSGTEPLVGKSRGWRVPSCADWVRGGSPTYKANGAYDCPANR